MSTLQLETSLKLLFCDVFQCCLHFSYVFTKSLNLHPFNHVSIFENQNKPWRIGWRSTKARHHIFFWLDTTKGCESMWHDRLSWCRSQSCVRHLTGIFYQQLPQKTLVLLCRTVDSQACTKEKNSFWRIASLFKKTDNMLLKSDFIYPNFLGWQEDDSSTGMTAALFQGHDHEPSFHLLPWT